MARAENTEAREKRRDLVTEMLLAKLPRREMAKLLKVSRPTVDADVKAIRESWRDRRSDAYERYASEDLARLDALLRAMWGQAMSGSTWHVDRCLSILERRSKLLGLDAPAASRVEIVTEDTIDAAIRQLEAELADNDDRAGTEGKAQAPRRITKAKS